VALHALDALEAQGERFDVLVLLQPTSPLRTPEDIDACVARVLEGGAQACVAVTRPPGAVGHYGFMDEAGRLDLATARTAGAGRAIATLSGACYAVQVETLRRGGTFLPDDAACVELPWRRYADIDTAEDFAVAERMARVLWEEGLGWRPLAGGARCCAPCCRAPRPGSRRARPRTSSNPRPRPSPSRPPAWGWSACARRWPRGCGPAGSRWWSMARPSAPGRRRPR
jgi:hypothetical protein